MIRTSLATLGLFCSVVIGGFAPAFAQDIDALPVTVTFVISGGMWELDRADLAEIEGAAPAAADTAPAPAPSTDAAADRARGYYKLVSVRQADRTAKVHLQQVEATESGPRLVNSVELAELTALKPYVTDIRPEDSTGITRVPGFMATVYLKTDPQAAEPESWTVLIDEFGEIRVERATN